MSMLDDPRGIVDIVSTNTYVLMHSNNNAKCIEIVDTTLGKAECSLPHYCAPYHHTVIKDSIFGETAICIGYQTSLPDPNPLKTNQHEDRTHKWAHMFNIIPTEWPSPYSRLAGNPDDFRILYFKNTFYLYTDRQLYYKIWYNATSRQIISQSDHDSAQYHEKIGYCRPRPGPAYDMEPLAVSTNFMDILRNLPLLADACLIEKHHLPTHKILKPYSARLCLNELGTVARCDYITDLICNPISETSQFYIQGYLYIKRLMLHTLEIIESTIIYLLKQIVEIAIEIIEEINSKIRLIEVAILYAATYYHNRDYLLALTTPTAYLALFGIFR
jgi:hypothetical protein